MVWQKGMVTFFEFFALFLPSLVNWLVPALCMSFAVPRGRPEAESQAVADETVGRAVIALFAVTDRDHDRVPSVSAPAAVSGDDDRPRACCRSVDISSAAMSSEIRASAIEALEIPRGLKRAEKPFDIFISMKRVEWDTLIFFYGVILCVGGLGALGYLTLLSQASYSHAWGPPSRTSSWALLRRCRQHPDHVRRPQHRAGDVARAVAAGYADRRVGGSLLSIGSAAGVALMGQARGIYTFFAHLKWTWAIALGYAASVWSHFLINASHF